MVVWERNKTVSHMFNIQRGREPVTVRTLRKLPTAGVFTVNLVSYQHLGQQSHTKRIDSCICYNGSPIIQSSIYR